MYKPLAAGQKTYIKVINYRIFFSYNYNYNLFPDNNFYRSVEKFIPKRESIIKRCFGGLMFCKRCFSLEITQYVERHDDYEDGQNLKKNTVTQ